MTKPQPAIVVCRNPSNGKLLAVMDEEDLAEFATYDEAEKAADNTSICMAWGYEILKVNI